MFLELAKMSTVEFCLLSWAMGFDEKQGLVWLVRHPKMHGCLGRWLKGLSFWFFLSVLNNTIVDYVNYDSRNWLIELKYLHSYMEA